MKEQLYQSELIIHGVTHTLSEWKNQLILVVNTATKCGFSSQFSELQALQDEYGEACLKVIGFPCDQFRHQEPENDESMGKFCALNFGISFDLAHKIEVNGQNADPLFQALTSLAPGLLGSKAIKWNFTKFLISANGEQILRFAPQTAPKKLKADINRMMVVK
ncbi:glutathione peroxidase [Psychromonas hadalis]|uniref:glutathione peroxidase n=1 Tax=Psychromonas hadalis TaxID=211669 RepID=UPI0003B4802B|nr:glutathione peroxidase [Psychromonas hadalis]